MKGQLGCRTKGFRARGPGLISATKYARAEQYFLEAVFYMKKGKRQQI